MSDVISQRGEPARDASEARPPLIAVTPTPRNGRGHMGGGTPAGKEGSERLLVRVVSMKVVDSFTFMLNIGLDK